MIQEQLRVTLLSLKQISDRLKTLIQSVLTKSEAEVIKEEILDAIENIPEPDLSTIAKEQTLNDGIQTLSDKIDNIDIDTSGLAKEATLERVEGKVDDISLSSETLGILAESWRQMVIDRETLRGWTFASAPNSVGEAIMKAVVPSQILEIDDYDSTTFPSGAYNILNAVKKIHFHNLSPYTDFSLGYFYNTSAVVEIELEGVSIFIQSPNQGTFRSCANLRKVYMPDVTSFVGSRLSFLNSPKLIDIKLGRMAESFSLSNWSPTEALLSNSQTLLTAEDFTAGFTSNLEKLLYNIREHIAANLPVAPLTITFSAAVKAAILADQPTADAFTSKGWTIA